MIHGDNPFVESPDQRDPVRRFRGRLAAPVTIVTSGSSGDRTGLTVSSLMVIEGEPGRLQMVLGPTSDLWDIVAKSERFVVHICHEKDRHLAEVFAGLRPNPGGVFAGTETRESDYGPVIEHLANRAYCRYVDREELGYSGVITGEVDEIEAETITDPLIYFRAGYHTLG